MTTKAEELPDIFTSEAPDNAVAPFANEGEMIVFDRTAKPKFKDGVLVRDRAGHYHLRIYAQGQNGRWRATSTSDAFLSFEEEADGLQLIAKAVYVRKPFGE
jgi:hypothetical protein